MRKCNTIHVNTREQISEKRVSELVPDLKWSWIRVRVASCPSPTHHTSSLQKATLKLYRVEGAKKGLNLERKVEWHQSYSSDDGEMSSRPELVKLMIKQLLVLSVWKKKPFCNKSKLSKMDKLSATRSGSPIKKYKYIYSKKEINKTVIAHAL